MWFRVKTCVCGHTQASHIDTALSVELTPKTPLYTLPTQPFNNVAVSNPNAPYVTGVCHCGCHSYEEC